MTAPQTRCPLGHENPPGTAVCETCGAPIAGVAGERPEELARRGRWQVYAVIGGAMVVLAASTAVLVALLA